MNAIVWALTAVAFVLAPIAWGALFRRLTRQHPQGKGA